VLSQEEPRDAAVNFDMYRIFDYNGIVRFLCHSTAFLYRLTSPVRLTFEALAH